MRILLVEDDESIISALTSFLKNEGIECISATGQKKAEMLIGSENFDLVLIDIILKDGNGFSVCSMVKEKTDTPVIFLTASCDEYSVVAGLDMGADDYIEKPYRPRELLSRIRSVLRRSGEIRSALHRN